jgi:hypothetical protein
MTAAFGRVGIGAAMEEMPMTVDVNGWLKNTGVRQKRRIASRFHAGERLLAEHEKNC